MTGKLIVHIGLPKTATTSVQISLFQNYNLQDLNYLGVVQPRSKKQKKEYYQFTNALDCKDSKSSKAIFDTKKTLQQLIRKSPQRNILISEEGITVDGALTNWQVKLSRLGEILKGFEYKVLVTVREPVSASYSLYCELYPKIKNKYPNFMDFFEHSNSVKIYHYDELIKHLHQKFDNKSIHYVQFEELKQGDKFVTSINDIIGIDNKDIIPINNENKKDIGTVGYITEPLNLQHIASNIRGMKIGIILMNIPVLNLIIKKIYNKVKFITFKKEGDEIPFLSESQKRYLFKEFKSGNSALLKESGINYL